MKMGQTRLIGVQWEATQKRYARRNGASSAVAFG
jgi:hypothetical protein